MRVKFSQTYKKNNGFIWGRLFSSSSLTTELWHTQYTYHSSHNKKLWNVARYFQFAPSVCDAKLMRNELEASFYDDAAKDREI